MPSVSVILPNLVGSNALADPGVPAMGVSAIGVLAIGVSVIEVPAMGVLAAGVLIAELPGIVTASHIVAQAPVHALVVPFCVSLVKT